MSQSRTMKTEFDDWDTDPDFVRDMNEMDQRWGSKRTVGSINMNKLINEVCEDHKTMRAKFDHPSQRDHSEGFGGKFGVQHDRKDQSALDYDYHEKLSKHSSQEISRKYISTSSSSIIKSGGVSDAKKNFLERVEKSSYEQKQPSDAGAFENRGPSPRHESRERIFKEPEARVETNSSKGPTYESSSSTKKVFREETRESSTSSRIPNDLPPGFKSIQEKIDAFKKDFYDDDRNSSKKPESTKVTRKTINTDFRRVGDDAEILSKFNQKERNEPPTSAKSTATFVQRDFPKDSIKSLSKKFETISMENSEDFKRRTEAKRKEFFDQIKTQVRETRKELDGFDPIDEDIVDIERKAYERVNKSGSQAKTSNPASPRYTPSPASRSSSRLGGGGGSDVGSQLSSRPKVYTKREVTQEHVVSKIIKENDKIIQNETKRNIERSSSCHGSSDEDEHEDNSQGPTSIRLIEKKLSNSPQPRTDSPVDRIKRQVPLIEPEIKGAGLMARTLYDYQATEDDELSFDVDDLITNIEKVDPGWYKGVITYNDGTIRRVGLFPANYVKLLNDTSEH